MNRHHDVMTIEQPGAGLVQDELNRHPDLDDVALGASDLAATLHREHVYIAKLLDRLAVDDAAEDRRALWSQALGELLAHAEAEEETVYVPLVRAGALIGPLEGVLEMHARLRDLLQEMADLDPKGSRFFARLEKLRSCMRQHQRAQGELLPAAARAVGLVALDQMCSAFLDRKMDLLYTA